MLANYLLLWDASGAIRSFSLHGMLNGSTFDSSEPMHISRVKKETPGLYKWDLRHHFMCYVHAESHMIMHQDNTTVYIYHAGEPWYCVK